MTIEITRPEVEALIQQRLQTGAFASPEDVILHALRSSEHERPSTPTRKFDNLSDLLLNSPFAGAELNLERQQDYPRALDIE
jgi:hypothetical protein